MKIKGVRVESRLINGDCLEEMDKLIAEGVRVDAIICDPPYGIDYDEWDVLHSNTNRSLGGNSQSQIRSSGFQRRGKPINGWSKSDKHNGKEYEGWLQHILEKAFKLAREASPIILFTSRRLQHNACNALEKSGFIIKDILIWKKPKGRLKAQNVNNVLKKRGKAKPVYDDYRLGNLRPDYEPIIYAFKPYTKTITDCFLSDRLGCLYMPSDNYYSNILEYEIERGCHPTQKSVKIMEHLVSVFTYKHHTVLDFTMGSGTTGVSCKNTNRNFIGIELDKNYFEIAQKRINETKLKLF